MNTPKIEYGFIFNGYMWINLLKLSALQVAMSQSDNDWDYERVGNEGPPRKTTYKIRALLNNTNIVLMDGIETKAEANEILRLLLTEIYAERR